MFSHEERCLYRKNQLGDVICQLRFPEILTISTTVPAAFQEAIRDAFPRYSVVQEPPVPTKGVQPTPNYQFTSLDGVWRVNLTDKFISLACSRYVCWEEFAGKLDKPLAEFISLYAPACFDRVGLRYLNFISRKALSLEGTDFKSLIRPCYLGPLAEEDVPETGTGRCSVDAELALRGGCRAKIHAGPGMVRINNQQDPEIRFIFDQDLYMPGPLPVNLSAGALQTLHSQAFPIFRGAITDRLHDALEPETL